MISAQDYINQAIGKSWKPCTYGPDSYDCWGLVVDSFEKIDGVKLPVLSAYQTSKLDLKNGMGEAIEKGCWARIEEPKDGCVVACLNEQGSLIHVGRYFFKQLFHSSGSIEVGGGVCLWPMRLTKKRFAKLEFYEWR